MRGNRFGDETLIPEGTPEIVGGFGGCGVEFEGPAAMDDGVVVLSLLAIGEAEIDVGVEIIGDEGERGTIAGDGFVDLAELDQRQAEIVVGLVGEAGSEPQGLAIVRQSRSSNCFCSASAMPRLL